MKELGIKWATVDDGYQIAEGDWELDTKRFPGGDRVQNASDLMMACPDVVDDKQLDDLSIAVTRMEESADEA